MPTLSCESGFSTGPPWGQTQKLPPAQLVGIRLGAGPGLKPSYSLLYPWRMPGTAGDAIAFPILSSMSSFKEAPNISSRQWESSLNPSSICLLRKPAGASNWGWGNFPILYCLLRYLFNWLWGKRAVFLPNPKLYHEVHWEPNIREPLPSVSLTVPRELGLITCQTLKKWVCSWELHAWFFLHSQMPLEAAPGEGEVPGSLAAGELGGSYSPAAGVSQHWQLTMTIGVWRILCPIPRMQGRLCNLGNGA